MRIAAGVADLKGELAGAGIVPKAACQRVDPRQRLVIALMRRLVLGGLNNKNRITAVCCLA
jgi:hypothetical protein